VGVLNKVGGALLLLGLAIAVIIGFQTPTGRRFWDGIWQAGATVVDFIRDQAVRLGGTPIAGNAWAAIGAAAILFLITITLVPGLRVGRGFAIMAVLFTALGFILYNPSVVG
jgi:hypothetical protein